MDGLFTLIVILLAFAICAAFSRWAIGTEKIIRLLKKIRDLLEEENEKQPLRDFQLPKKMIRWENSV